MASKIECPRCGGLSASFVQGVCRACYMRDYHQRRSAAAVTQCPRCGVASANFIQGVCRACYMRDYHQRRSAAAAKDKQIAQPNRTPQLGEVRPARRPLLSANQDATPAAMSPLRRQSPREPGALGAHAGMAFETPTLGNSEGQRLCVECETPRIYARGLCVNCYMRGYMRDRHRQRRLLCVECGEPGTYARGLCRNCYISDLRQRQRSCVECGATGTYARGLCQNCYTRDLRRQRRMKHRACVVCGVSFLSARSDALYCSPSCCQQAHRGGKALFPEAAHVGKRGAVQSAIEMQDATLAPRIEVQAHAVADLDRTQIDSTIEEATKRGRTNAALSAIDGYRQAHQVPPRAPQDALTLADLKAERATLGGNGRQIEAEAAPIRHVAEPIGAEPDSEWAIRWLLALMMLCCDPPGRASTAAASARNRPQSDAALPKIMDDVLQVAG
jgi:hypothetical protein